MWYNKMYEFFWRDRIWSLIERLLGSYGPSGIRLEKLDMTSGFGKVRLKGKEFTFPLLNLKKYDSECECYALIERMYCYPIVMVDIMYSYKDILPKFESDEEFRNNFLSIYSRKFINIASQSSPALMLAPKKNKIEIKPFIDASQKAFIDATQEGRVYRFYKKVEGNLEEEVPVETREDMGNFEEFLMDILEVLTNTNFPKKVEKRKVNFSLIKNAVLMKSGATIIGTEEVSKYFTTFQTEVDMDDVQVAKNSISINISGVDDNLLLSSQEYLRRFGEDLLDSNVLEVFSYLNSTRLPKLSYVGQYNENEHKVQVNKRLEKYFNQMNDFFVPQRPEDEGR